MVLHLIASLGANVLPLVNGAPLLTHTLHSVGVHGATHRAASRTGRGSACHRRNDSAWDHRPLPYSLQIESGTEWSAHSFRFDLLLPLPLSTRTANPPAFQLGEAGEEVEANASGERESGSWINLTGSSTNERGNVYQRSHQQRQRQQNRVIA